ncbi:class I adenylate-forming enzyme family protein [Variovorax sp. PAMC 28711]|uniref:class I adenylate-forming enzyme family protein n=1 Tax=Variovorax sp. PAMC 28711 TaxID=1795631 RepID=UPI00078B3E47|nr:class I adenylate-forming enzyme family protein [Variovorax sp. PAMC 28711]AMM23759.1 hypothetical protein AX767_04920 [Variovorax sp. PAMC 28711]
MQALSATLADRIQSLPPRMSHVVRPWADRTPDAPALLEGEHSLTYGELAEAISAVGEWLRSHGVRAGDRVMVVGENSMALAVLILSIGDIDAWPLVANARLSAREVDAIRTHSGARLQLFTSEISVEAAAHAARCGASVQGLPWIGTLSVGPLDADASVEPVSSAGTQQVGALIYTSGTTGAPKGVMLSHHSILFTAAIGGMLRDVRPDDRIYGVLPMSHIVGFSSVLLGTLMCGASLDLVPRFDAAATLSALSTRGITRLQGVPTMYQRLLEASSGSVACPDLRTIGVAGAPLDASLKTAVEAAFGLPLDNGYGITECSPTIAITRSDDIRHDTTVGRCIPGVEVRLCGPDGTPVGDDGVGELHARGPNVMLGYYKAPEMTAAVVDGSGWFNTGDLARFDGPYLHIVGRTKELIIRSGFNVYPPEVEAVLTSHPAVAVCAVVGRKVPGNEEVVAFVQLRAGASAGADDIAAFAAQHLAPYKRPTEVIVRQTLPATSAGKILKHQLAKEASHHEQ